jgi:hypothetical protein
MRFCEAIKFGYAPVAIEVEARRNRWYRKPLEAGNRLINRLQAMREKLICHRSIK